MRLVTMTTAIAGAVVLLVLLLLLLRKNARKRPARHLHVVPPLEPAPPADEAL